MRYRKKLNSDGYHVIARDHRGHGININKKNTQGYFADTNGWFKVRDDLKETISYAKSKFPDLPCFLLGCLLYTSPSPRDS